MAAVDQTGSYLADYTNMYPYVDSGISSIPTFPPAHMMGMQGGATSSTTSSAHQAHQQQHQHFFSRAMMQQQQQQQASMQQQQQGLRSCGGSCMFNGATEAPAGNMMFPNSHQQQPFTYPAAISADWNTYYNNSTGQQQQPQTTSTNNGPYTSSSFVNNGSGTALPISPLSSTTSASVHSKRQTQAGSTYTHNPYASSETSSNPDTPVIAADGLSSHMPPYSSLNSGAAMFVPSMQLSHNNNTAAADALAASGGYPQQNGSEMLPPPTMGGNNSNNNPANALEQFQTCTNISATACTTRGRHMLLSVLRLQQPDKTQRILEEVTANLGQVVLDLNGCHVVRSLIEFLTEEQLHALVQCMSRDMILQLCTANQHTRRVIQSFFETHKSLTLDPIVDVMSEHAVALATTQQGCIAVMRVIESSLDEQKQRLQEKLLPVLAALTMDPYGNYVVQSIVQHNPREVASGMVECAFEGHWVSLSCNKYASNVMEKVIHTATPTTREAILSVLCYDVVNLEMLSKDGFGNFVIQALIDTCNNVNEFKRMSDLIRPLLPASPFAHKIELRLKNKRFNRMLYPQQQQQPQQ